MPGRFGAVATAMATPFTADGALDVSGVRTLAAHLYDHGTETIVAAGTTGESPTLTIDEKRILWETVVGVAADKGKKVVCGTGTYSTAESIELTILAEECGADGVLVVTPYYNKPPQRALVEHFSMVAGATELPVLLYNIPGRTATRIEHATLLTLAAVPNIVGVKDSTGDFDGATRLMSEAPDGFDVYTGDDWSTFEYACLGGAGVVSVAAHLVGERMSEMIGLVESGDVAAARKIHEDLAPLCAALFCTTSPIPLKAALEMLGLPGGPLRPPMFAATDDERATVRSALADAGLL